MDTYGGVRDRGEEQDCWTVDTDGEATRFKHQAVRHDDSTSEGGRKKGMGPVGHVRTSAGHGHARPVAGG